MAKPRPSFLPSLPMLLILFCAPGTLAQTNSQAQWIAFNRAGAPNSNLQCFTLRNVTVKEGYLIITTKVESASCSSFDLPQATYGYTSGFIAMKSFNFLYGTVEFRAKFGGGPGTGAWPIVWMEDASCQASDPTGTDDRCNGQEIDIAEMLNSDSTHINQQIHVSDFKYNDGCLAPTTDASQNFHVYQLVWSSGSLAFKIDGTTTCGISKPYVPNAPMYVKMDNFVGNAGGSVNDTSLPWSTLIDYVKVTQGGTVVFDDDFDSSGDIQPALPAPRSSYHPGKPAIPAASSHWLLGTVVLCLVIAVAVTASGLARLRN